MRELIIEKKITHRETRTALDKYLADIAKCPLPNVEREVELFQELEILNPKNKELPKQLKEFDLKTKEKIEKVVEEITESNLRFVVSVAKQYQQSNIELWDLINEWNIWLVKAIYKFDYTRWFKFISFAVRPIRQSILKFLSENSIIHIPENVKNLMRDVWRYIEECGFIPDKEALKEKFKLTDKQYESLMKWCTSKTLSLDVTLDPDDDKSTLWNTLRDESIPAPDYYITKKTEKSWIMWALEELLSHQRTYRRGLVCALYYWLNPNWVNPEEKRYSFLEIAENFHDMWIYEGEKANKAIIEEEKNIRDILSNALTQLAEMLNSDWTVSEDYLNSLKTKSSSSLLASNILENASIEKIKWVLEPSSKAKFKEWEAYIFSLYTWIPYSWNPKWKKRTFREIAQEIGRPEPSTRTAFNRTAKKIAKKLGIPLPEKQ